MHLTIGSIWWIKPRLTVQLSWTSLLFHPQGMSKDKGPASVHSSISEMCPESKSCRLMMWADQELGAPS